MYNLSDHIIESGKSIKDALFKLNILGGDAILFVIDEKNVLLGSLTDGDVRRGLIRGINIEDKVDVIIQANPKYIRIGQANIFDIVEYRESNIRILPVLDSEDKLVRIINFRKVKSCLPVDVVVMAGGRGKRLMPLTESIPKPLLKVGDKPIIEHNIDRLAAYGIVNFWLSVRYLGKLIEDYFGSGINKKISINYLWENEPLGTIGAVANVNEFHNEYLLVTNSDILTDLDYEQFFIDFIQEDADLSILTIPYNVNVPYAVLETHEKTVLGLTEKPSYTYYSNGGIYLMKKAMVDLIPKDSFYNATDLIESLINLNKKVVSFPLSGYWLDVGKHEDFAQAQKDIKKISRIK